MGKLFVMVVRISKYMERKNLKTIFRKNDFSLLKSLHEKHRFVQFLGLERGGPTNGCKLVFPNVFLVFGQNQPSYAYSIVFH